MFEYGYSVQNILIGLGIFVVLPVMIVWLVSREKQNKTNRMTEVMLKAIESGTKVDAEFFKNNSQNLSVKEKMLNRLTVACVTTLLGVIILCVAFVVNGIHDEFYEDLYLLLIFAGGVLLAVGIGLFIAYFVGKKMLAKEIEAEEKSLKEDK